MNSYLNIFFSQCQNLKNTKVNIELIKGLKGFLKKYTKKKIGLKATSKVWFYRLNVKLILRAKYLHLKYVISCSHLDW